MIKDNGTVNAIAKCRLAKRRKTSVRLTFVAVGIALFILSESSEAESTIYHPKLRIPLWNYYVLKPNVDDAIPEPVPPLKWCSFERNPEYSKNEEFGTAVDTDKCCKKFKFCDEYIPAKNWKYGLHNVESKPRMSCSCELEFYDCLQNVAYYDEPLDAPYASAVGLSYFHEARSPCFLKARGPLCDGKVLYDIKNNTYASDKGGTYFCGLWSSSKLWEGD